MADMAVDGPVITLEEQQDGTDVTSEAPVLDASAMDEGAAAAAPEVQQDEVVAEQAEGIAGENVMVDQQQLEAAQEDPAAEVKKEISEEDRLWNQVRENPADFAAWTNLLSEVEKNIGENLDNLRVAYDAFLLEFPLCYGYWKKYADHERRYFETQQAEPDKTEEVYERGVAAVAYSADMWMHYLVFKSKAYTSPEEVRSLYERGLTYVATDYSSHTLWDKCLEFETEQKDWVRIAQLYTRCLSNPGHQLDRYWNDFKAFAASHPLAEIQSPEEAAAAAAAALAVAPETEPEPAPPAEGEDAEFPPTEEGSKAGKTEVELVEEYIAVREELYKASKERDNYIKDYEINIKRPWFHSKPLDGQQIQVWHRYLDYVEKEGDFGKIVNLYERCLIPCASYPEFWIRYVSRLEGQDFERASEALQRATCVFVKRRPEIHLFAAKFREQHGDIEGAQAAYCLILQSIAPGLIEAIVRYANLERRQGNVEAGCSLYETAMQSEKDKEDSRNLQFLYMQYAHYLDQAAGKPEKARELYSEAVEKLPISKSIWQGALTFEIAHPGDGQVKRVQALGEQAMVAVRSDGTPCLTAADKEEIATMVVEFVDLLGDTNAFFETESWFKTHFPPRRTGAEGKKRSASDVTAGERALKHQKVHGGSAHHVQGGMQGGYANGQWAPQGYGAQGGYGAPSPQGWQQPPSRPSPGAGVPPAQHGWGGSYAQQAPQQQAPPQQAAYGGYNGAYGYAPPAQTPAPQQQAYSAYSQPYAAAAPAAYPQQSYAAPPAVTAAVSPAAAATPSAQQAYYAQSYYPQQ